MSAMYTWDIHAVSVEAWVKQNIAQFYFPWWIGTMLVYPMPMGTVKLNSKQGRYKEEK